MTFWDIVVLRLFGCLMGADWCCFCWAALTGMVFAGWCARSEILRVAQNDKGYWGGFPEPFVGEVLRMTILTGFATF